MFVHDYLNMIFVAVVVVIALNVQQFDKKKNNKTAEKSDRLILPTGNIYKNWIFC